MFAGVCGGIAGILYASSYAALTPEDGINFLLPVVAAVILAGFALRGGRGHMWTLFLSVGFLSTVRTSLVFFGLSSDWQLVVQGLILIIAVSIDSYREKRSIR
jgi:ribose transport system permease protein